MAQCQSRVQPGEARHPAAQMGVQGGAGSVSCRVELHDPLGCKGCGCGQRRSGDQFCKQSTIRHNKGGIPEKIQFSNLKSENQSPYANKQTNKRVRVGAENPTLWKARTGTGTGAQEITWWTRRLRGWTQSEPLGGGVGDVSMRTGTQDLVQRGRQRGVVIWPPLRCRRQYTTCRSQGPEVWGVDSLG